MLPMQTNPAIQTDALSTQNIARLDQFQPQVFSLLMDTDNPPPRSKPRRKKTPKLDETTPVMINPHIARDSTGVAFAVSYHHRSTRSPESSSLFPAPHPTDDSELFVRLYIDNSYNANVNTSHKQIPMLPIPLNRSSPVQTQPHPARMNVIIPGAHTNSLIPLVAQSQFCGLNPSLTSHSGERIVAVSSSQQNLYQRLYSPYLYLDQSSSSVDRHHSPPTPLPATPPSSIPACQSKRRAPKRMRPAIFTKQPPQPRNYAPCPTIPTQSAGSIGLPSIIPASVNVGPFRSDDHCLLKDMTPPSSISSTKSSPTGSNYEFPLISMKQPPTTIPEVGSTSRAYLSSEEYSSIREPNHASFTNHLQYMSPNDHGQYGAPSCQVRPTNLMTIPCFSGLPGAGIQTSPVPTPTGAHTERKRRKKTAESSVSQTSTPEQTLAPKLSLRDKSAIEKRKHIKSSTKDRRAKHELRRIAHRNRLAVFKFMMRKRRQKKQERTSTTNLPDEEVGSVSPQLDSPSVNRLEHIEPVLPEIIAPCLKISIDAGQNIESISLHYHRRRQAEGTIRADSPMPTSNADNKLGLLIEAVEFIETLRENAKLDTLSVK